MSDRPGDGGGLRPEGQFKEACGGGSGLRGERQKQGLSPCWAGWPGKSSLLSLSAEDGFIAYRKTAAYLKSDLLRVGARQGCCVPLGHSAVVVQDSASSWPSAGSVSLSPQP